MDYDFVFDQKLDSLIKILDTHLSINWESDFLNH